MSDFTIDDEAYIILLKYFDGDVTKLDKDKVKSLNQGNFDGKEISHIVNPKTLSNISNLNILVTVIHNECAIADAIATGLLAMDPKDIISFSDKNEIATFLVITNDEESKKYYSKEFINYLSAK